MKSLHGWFAVTGLLTLVCCGGRGSAAGEAGHFTHLRELSAPKIIDSAQPYPGSSYLPVHLTDGWGHTEYASHGKGTETFVDFDFGKAVPIAAFRHVDRMDPATVDEAELFFSDRPDFGHVIQKQVVDHVNKPGGVTVVTWSKPVTARYVRWKATKANARGHSCLGGSEIRFFAADRNDAIPSADQISVRPVQALKRTSNGLVQPVAVQIDHPYAEPIDVILTIEGVDPIPMQLRFGTQTVRVELPAVDEERASSVAVALGGKPLLSTTIKRRPVRHWELYILPHSHVDIGYTHVQAEVEKKQWEHFRNAIVIARKTADYPPEARFKWNTETLWAVDSYLKKATVPERKEFFEAIQKGWLHLDGLYGNELTALCRPEELMQLAACARRLSKQYDVTIDSAMISDVPGYTWGVVPALAQNGIKYLSIGPNHTHRIGFTLDQWGDRPFWWVSPSGESRLLCWMAGKAYSWFHSSRVGTLTTETSHTPFFKYLDELADKSYPYDMVQIRYSIGGDNGPPDPGLPEFVKAWNEKYVWPRMIITTTGHLMRSFEQRYGATLPEVRGDFTPYWEDGAASSAKETGMTRNASERLVQAEVLWAILNRGDYPAEEFRAAWRNAILYNEHTWGAHCSITEPESPFTTSQWKVKQAFAVDVDKQSRELLDKAIGGREGKPQTVATVDVYNTTSWPRTDLVRLDAALPLAGHAVEDMDGNAVPSQVSPRGHLMFVARDVPPLGAKRFRIKPGDPHKTGHARVEGNVLSTPTLRVELDPKTGTIVSLQSTRVPFDLARRDDGLNKYVYVSGRDAKQRAASQATRIEPYPGHLASSLVVYSRAPGCRQLITIVRVIDGIDRVDLINLVDKEKVLSKEAVHLAFPLHVPDGVMRMDIPWAVMRPESDQLPGACKNYLTVGRWVDVSGKEGGVTWTTRDAPLVEVGAIRVDVPSAHGTDGWVRHLEKSQTFFSYIMNNYWETNYKASQEGMTVFRYSLLPHGRFDQAAVERFGIERSQPLIARPADASQPVIASRLRVEPDSVLVTSLKPSEDGKALIVRLWNAGGEPARATLKWSDPKPRRVMVSKPGQAKEVRCEQPLTIPPMGIRTLRADMPRQVVVPRQESAEYN